MSETMMLNFKVNWIAHISALASRSLRYIIVVDTVWVKAWLLFCRYAMFNNTYQQICFGEILLPDQVHSKVHNIIMNPIYHSQVL